MILCGYVPDAQAILANAPLDENGNPYLPWENRAHAHPMIQSGTDEEGNPIYVQKNEEAMAIISCEEIPPCLQIEGVEAFMLPEQLADAKAKAQAVGIEWNNIPQIFGMEFE